MTTSEKGFWHKTKEVGENIWEGTKNVTEDMWDGTKNVAGSIKDVFTGYDDDDEFEEEIQYSADLPKEEFNEKIKAKKMKTAAKTDKMKH